MKVLDQDGDGVITAKELEDLKVRVEKHRTHIYYYVFLNITTKNS